MKRDEEYFSYYEDLSTKNLNIISALEFALRHHKNQYRKSGEPYIEHCLEVYKILKGWGIENEELLMAALLHDVVEDTGVRISDIRKEFGSSVASLVKGVTQFNLNKKKDKDFSTLKKVISGSYVDPKISILKLADRYHNLSTLQYVPAEKREKKAKESLEVYAKLAESLGLWVVKTEIEDLSFKYLHFEKFTKVKTALDQDKRLSSKETLGMINTIKDILCEFDIKGRVEVKKSGYFEAYQKLKLFSLKGLSSNENYREINDIVSYRIIVKKEADCYQVLYAIHHKLGPAVDFNRFDEFVGANKRLNGYQALQTTLDTMFGSIEIAISTEEMENFNDWGYVYHLRTNKETSGFKLKLVFTPDHDLIFLPANAIAIDLAYAINVKLGDNSIKVLVNGKDEGLDYLIKNTDTVKVITGERSLEEDEELLEISLPQTKDYIQKKIVGKEKSVSINEGISVLENHLSPRGILDLHDIGSDIHRIVYGLGCTSVNEIYYRASKGYLNVEKLDSLLNEAGISKNKLGWTSIKIRGKDKPGLLKVIANNIAELGGNVIKITFQKDESTDNYDLRIVAEGLKQKDISKIKDSLKKEGNFEELTIV